MHWKNAMWAVFAVWGIVILMSGFNDNAQAAPLSQQQWYVHPSGADGCGMGYGDPSIESDPNKVGTFTGINLQTAAIMRCNATYMVKAGAKAYGSWTWVHLNGPDKDSKGWAVLVGRDWAWGPYVPPTPIPLPTSTPTPVATAIPMDKAAGIFKVGKYTTEIWPVANYGEEAKRGNIVAWDRGMLYTNAPSLIIGVHNMDNNRNPNPMAGTELAKLKVGDTISWTPTNGVELKVTVRATVIINNDPKDWERMILYSRFYKLTSVSCAGQRVNGDWNQRVVVFAN